jgi:xanthine dehydrogenase YagR molybdenum-binding subunit
VDSPKDLRDQGGRGGAGQPPPPPADPKYSWPAAKAVLGTSVQRLDAPEKVSGRAKYTFDITRPGMLYGRIVRSPHPHARIVSIDLTAARRAPGVKVAMAWRDPADPQRNVVMYQGDEVAALAADTEERAIDAARLVKVEYEVLPHLINVDQVLAGNAPAVFTGGNVRPGQTQETGDLAAGFKAAAHVVEETYATHVITHVCLE